MKSTPLVSVVMTAYNRENYVATAIESVLSQTFQDFELIIVDDCSTDATVEVARRYLIDPRVSVVVNDTNLGDYPNRNRAAKLARGEFLKFHDSDDLMYPHCLSIMTSLLIAEPRAAIAVSVGRAWAGGPCPMLLTPELSYRREFLGRGLFSAGPAACLFRSEVFDAFPEEGVCSDYLFWIDICAHHNLLLVTADLFWYRSHAGQELQSTRAERDYARVQGAAWKALNRSGCPLRDEALEQAKRNVVWVLAKQVYQDLRARRLDLARIRVSYAELSAGDWLRYTRRQSRSDLAGTPVDGNGEYIIPGWARLPSSPSLGPIDLFPRTQSANHPPARVSSK